MAPPGRPVTGRLARLAAALAGVGGLLIPFSMAAPPAGAIAARAAAPATSPLGCGGYYWSLVCYQIVGTGLRVQYFLTSITNETWPGTLYVEVRIVGPRFASLWYLYGVDLANTATPIFRELDQVFAPGTYCAQFDIYRLPVAQRCYQVHA